MMSNTTRTAESFINQHLGEFRSILAQTQEQRAMRQHTPFSNLKNGKGALAWAREYVEKSTGGTYTLREIRVRFPSDTPMIVASALRWTLIRLTDWTSEETARLLLNLKRGETIKISTISPKTGEELVLTATASEDKKSICFESGEGFCSWSIARETSAACNDKVMHFIASYIMKKSTRHGLAFKVAKPF